MKENKILEFIKEHKIMVSVITMILVLIITGTTLAIYFIGGEGKEKKYVLGNINVKYIDGDIIKAENAIPLSDKEIEKYATKKEFKFKNTGDQTLYAEILLTEIEMDESLKSNDFRWELYEEDNKISAGSFINVNDNKTLSLKRGIRVDVESEPKNYKILVYIADNGGNQNDMEETSMKAKIKIKATDKPTEYEDNSGVNPPKLADGMIPVTYDEERNVWIKASTMKKWYDYDNQMWANAVTVGSDASNCIEDCIDDIDKNSRKYYLNAEVGTPISMDDINSMWVWIPRFKYKIPSSIGKSTTNPPEIDVVFENGLSATGVSEKVYKAGIKDDGTNDNYYTHPAFRDGSKVYNKESYDIGGWDHELTGIWVGKFLNSSTNDLLEIKPNKLAKTASVYDNFKQSLIISNGTYDENTGNVTYTNNIDNPYGLNIKNNTTSTHMMKNTEWGMVAYLSQSKYGKMGNKNYSNEEIKIYKNNSSSYYTGRSIGNNVYTTDTNAGNYSYNNFECQEMDNKKCTGEEIQYKGTGASSTGTIYGVYDMVGFTIYLMGRCSIETSSNDTTLTNIEKKYYDSYTCDNQYTNTKNISILGDALWETQSWYYCVACSPYNSEVWVHRPGNYIFCSDSDSIGNTVNHTVLIPE